MNVVQLVMFAWVSVWVLCDSFMPSMAHVDKLRACAIAAFVAAYTNNAHGELWKVLKRKKREDLR
ncbi:MAG: hypothetical protein BGO43_03280 [Gammaproteobacteria bacterium 39-13]|nr:MAG: hypothetical protein BGO43_03280 [Gammaproteobacteria bacterium 39-13]